MMIVGGVGIVDSVEECVVIGRAQRARTSELNGNFVFMFMSSTDRGQCACVPAQRANVAGLASSARCARPQHSPSVVMYMNVHVV